MTETEIDTLRRDLRCLADTLAMVAHSLGVEWSGLLNEMGADCNRVINAAAAVRRAERHSPAPTGVSEGYRVGETSTEAHSGVHWCSPDCVDPDTWDASCPLNAGLDGPPVHKPARVPQVWQAGDPDNPALGEVKAVTDRLGEQWFPSLRADYATSWFCDREAQNRSWSRLLAEFGPLTEVVE